MRPYKLGLYEKSMPVELAFKDKLLAAKEAGYDFLEISVDETDEKLNRLEMSALERREMRLLSESIGTPVKTMCLSGHRRFPLGSRSAETRARGMEIMEKAVVLAADLSIRVIQLAGYDVYYEERGDDTEAYFAENLAV